MAKTTSLPKIQESILKKRGIVGIKRSTKSQRKLKHISNIVQLNNKTRAMEFLELKYGLDIVSILVSGSLNHIAQTYKIDRSTASKWRKRLREEILKFLQSNPYIIMPEELTEPTELEGETDDPDDIGNYPTFYPI